LEKVAHSGSDRLGSLLLYQMAIMGIERSLHGRFERFGLTPLHHQGEGLLNELLVDALLPMDLAEELRSFMAVAGVHDATLRAEQLPWSEDEIRGLAGNFHKAFQELASS
jgi:hypothetical protein